MEAELGTINGEGSGIIWHSNMIESLLESGKSNWLSVSFFPIGEGASPGSHPRIMPTLLPAGMGDRDWRRNQSEKRVSV